MKCTEANIIWMELYNKAGTVETVWHIVKMEEDTLEKSM